MTPAREAAGVALAALYEASKHFDTYDTAVDRRRTLEVMCVKSEADLTKATQELKAAKDQLAQVTTQLTAKKRFIEDQYARSTQAIEEHIAAAQGELSGLTARIAKSRQAIVAIDASTQSLIKRLHLGA